MKLYTLWIIPTEPLYSETKNVIEQLSKKYKGPMFEPHMTLLGNIPLPLSEIAKKTKKLAQSIKPFKLLTGPVSFSTTYFQSVLLRVNSISELMSLNLNAKKIMKMKNDVFMPHISLMYGDHDMETRAEAVLGAQSLRGNFKAEGFVITPSTMNPNEWLHLEEVPFG